MYDVLNIVCLLQTTELWADVEGPHYQFTGLDFLLLAITSDGLVTEAIPVDKAKSQQQSESLGRESTPLTVHVSVSESVLETTVSWELPPGHQSGDYQVRWGREKCECEAVGGVDDDTMYLSMQQHQVNDATETMMPYIVS